jgi:hypothetical protein
LGRRDNYFSAIAAVPAASAIIAVPATPATSTIRDSCFRLRPGVLHIAHRVYPLQIHGRVGTLSLRRTCGVRLPPGDE